MFYEITFVFSNKEFTDFQPQAPLMTKPDRAAGMLDAVCRVTDGSVTVGGAHRGVALGGREPAGRGSRVLGPRAPSSLTLLGRAA